MAISIQFLPNQFFRFGFYTTYFILLQLAAVEEEKRQLENQLSQLAQSNNNQLAQMQSQVDSDRQRLEIEKEELERQLQSSQKCFVSIDVVMFETEIDEL